VSIRLNYHCQTNRQGLSKTRIEPQVQRAINSATRSESQGSGMSLASGKQTRAKHPRAQMYPKTQKRHVRVCRSRHSSACPVRPFKMAVKHGFLRFEVPRDPALRAFEINPALRQGVRCALSLRSCLEDSWEQLGTGLGDI